MVCGGEDDVKKLEEEKEGRTKKGLAKREEEGRRRAGGKGRKAAGEESRTNGFTRTSCKA